MDLLNKLGSAENTKYASIDTLKENEYYPIEEWLVLNTKYGRQIAVLINGLSYFLPNRFGKITDAEIITYNEKSMALIYLGKKKFNSYAPTAILKFTEV
jgi:hypothetical protein